MKKIQKTAASNEEMITISRAEYEEQRAYIAELEQQNQWLMEQLNVIQKKKSGSTPKPTAEVAVKVVTDTEPPILLFNEAEKIVSAPPTSESEAGPLCVQDILPKSVKVKVVEHDLPKEERACPRCGKTMIKSGQEERFELLLSFANARLQRHVYLPYRCRNCKTTANTAQASALIPGDYASAEGVAYVMTQKYALRESLHRQEQDWYGQEVMLSRQIMASWLIFCADRWLSPVYDALHAELLQYDYIQVVEAPVQVQRESRRKPPSSEMRVYRTGRGAKYPVVLYEYPPEDPAVFLEGFHGYLQTDGDDRYHALTDVVHVGSIVHLRRLFDDATSAGPKGKIPSNAGLGLSFCISIFCMEQKLNELTPEERFAKRLEQEKPLLEDILSWAKSMRYSPKSKTGKALAYLTSQWEYLTNYLLDPRLEVGILLAERNLELFEIGRGNWLFANTPKGARSSSIIYSLIVTAKQNRLDPNRYLCWVLKQAPLLSQNNSDWAKELVPRKAPPECRAPGYRKE